MRSLLLSTRFLLPVAAPLALAATISSNAFADPESTGAPPPDQAALVAAPKAGPDAPKISAAGTDSTSATVSAGGQLATGNSRLLAMTANAKFEMRRGANGFGAAFIGNYGEAALPGAPLVTTTENFQGRLRYDRYFADRFSIFLIGTARHDKFQGLDGRLNLDPGLKYLFVLTDPTQLWGEVGYDFQYDARNGDSLAQPPDAAGNAQPPLAQTVTDHSVRAFVGFKHAFNGQVTLVSGIEYLQGLYSSENTSAKNYDYRINFDALFAANVGAGFSVGVGFSARYDNVPLPTKENLDTITTLNLIYAFSDAAPPPPTCPCPDPAPPPPPAPPPAPSVPATPAASAAPARGTTTTTVVTTTTTAPAAPATTTATTPAPATPPATPPP